jgi:hypothetical protein
MLGAAQPADRVSLMIRYNPDVKPVEAERAYNAIEGLKASREYPPLVTVTGSKGSVEAALGHELTEAAVTNFQDYYRYFLSARPPGPRGR